MEREKSPDMWLGLKRCGCPVSVCVDDKTRPSDVEESKMEFVRDGLQLKVVTWAEWREEWMPKFQANCPHDELVLT